MDASEGMPSQVAQWVKNPPAMQETQETRVLSLGWEDPLEKGTAIHSSILAWRIPGLYSPWSHKELDATERLSLSLSLWSFGFSFYPPFEFQHRA